MYIVCNRIVVNPEFAGAFEERFAQRAGLVDGMDGFLAFQLLKPDQPDTPYIVMTTWASEAHYQAWIGSEEFKQQHANTRTLPPQALKGRPVLETFTVVQENIPTQSD